MEGDCSPPMGARRRFSALMDTHRFAAPQEGDGELAARQGATKTPGSSVEEVTAPSSPNANEQRNAGKEVLSTSATKVAGEKTWMEVIQVILIGTKKVPFRQGCTFADKPSRLGEVSAPQAIPTAGATALLSRDMITTSDQIGQRATKDLVLRRARHQQLSSDGEKHPSRPSNKVIKSASATALSVMIPGGTVEPSTSRGTYFN